MIFLNMNTYFNPFPIMKYSLQYSYLLNRPIYWWNMIFLWNWDNILLGLIYLDLINVMFRRYWHYRAEITLFTDHYNRFPKLRGRMPESWPTRGCEHRWSMGFTGAWPELEGGCNNFWNKLQWLTLALHTCNT